MNMNLFQEALPSSSATPAAAAAATGNHNNSNSNNNTTNSGNNNTANSASTSNRTGPSSLGVMTNVSKLFFASTSTHRRASNESAHSARSSHPSASEAARRQLEEEEEDEEDPLPSEEALRRRRQRQRQRRTAESARMDEFRALLAGVRLSHPGLSMAQAQHLTLLKLSGPRDDEKGGSDRGSGEADADGPKGAAIAGRAGQDRRRRRSLVAMDDKDENRRRLLPNCATRGEGGHPHSAHGSHHRRHQDANGGGGGNLAPPMAVGGFLRRRNARNLNPLAKSLPAKEGNDHAGGTAMAMADQMADRHRPLLQRPSVRDPMLQSMRQLQEELGGVDWSEDGGDSHGTGEGPPGASGGQGGTGRRRGSGGMFRRRGSRVSGGGGGRLRRRASSEAASSRSDLSIRSERSLEAERIRKGILCTKGDGNKKKKGGIRSSARKLLRLGSHGSSKKMRDGDSESAGSSQSGDHAHHRPKRRASQAPSLPDIGEDEEVRIKSDGDTSSGNHLREGGGRRYSDISIEVPSGDLICRWDNLSRDSIGGDSRISLDESDGLICGWANASNNGSSRRHTMAGSSSGDVFAVALDNDHEDENESRRGSL